MDRHRRDSRDQEDGQRANPGRPQTAGTSLSLAQLKSRVYLGQNGARKPVVWSGAERKTDQQSMSPTAPAPAAQVHRARLAMSPRDSPPKRSRQSMLPELPGHRSLSSPDDVGLFPVTATISSPVSPQGGYAFTGSRVLRPSSVSPAAAQQRVRITSAASGRPVPVLSSASRPTTAWDPQGKWRATSQGAAGEPPPAEAHMSPGRGEALMDTASPRRDVPGASLSWASPQVVDANVLKTERLYTERGARGPEGNAGVPHALEAGSGIPHEAFRKMHARPASSRKGSRQVPSDGATAASISAMPTPPILAAVRQQLRSSEFVYLTQREENSTIYNPYDLTIVHHASLNQDHYFTISTQGITQYLNGIADFTPMDQWEREYHLFHFMKTLNVFKLYKIWKGFATWRKCVRKRKTNACRVALQEKLFHLQRYHQKALLKIRKICQEISLLQLQGISKGEIYSLDRFQEVQQQKQQEVQGKLEQFMYRIVAILARTCQRVLDALEERLAAGELRDEDGPAQLGATGGIGLGAGGATWGGATGGVGSSMISQGGSGRPGTAVGRPGTATGFAGQGGLARPGTASGARAGVSPKRRSLSAGGNLLSPSRGRGADASWDSEPAASAKSPSRPATSSAGVRGVLQRRDHGASSRFGDATMDGDGSKDSYAKTAARRSEQRKLLNFIQLVEFMVCHVTHTLLCDSLEDMLQVVCYKEPTGPLDSIYQDGRTSHLEDEDDRHRVHGARTPTPTPLSAAKPPSADAKAKGAVADASKGAKVAAGAGAGAGLLGVDGDLMDIGELGARAAETCPVVFSVEILLENEQLLFQPAADKFVKEVDAVIARFVDTFASIKRLVTNPALQPFLDAGGLSSSLIDSGRMDYAGNAPSTAMLDSVSAERQLALLERVHDSTARVFEDAHVYKAAFEPYRRLFLENLKVSSEVMWNECLRNDGTRTLHTFEADIKRFQRQYKDIEGLNENQDIGIVRVDTKRLKATLLPSPQSCTQMLHALLPRLAAHKYQTFIAEVHSARARLLSTAADVDEFVEYLQFLDETMANFERFEDTFAEVKSYYELLERFDIPVDDLDNAAYLSMPADFADLKSALDTAEANRDDHIAVFSKGLEKEVAGLLADDVADITQLGRQEMVLDESSQGEAVLAYLGQLNSKMSHLKARGKRIKEHQRLFKVAESNMSELDGAAEELELKTLLWQSLQEWETLVYEWNEMPFSAMEVTSVEETVMRFVKASLRIERGLPPCPLVFRLKTEVDKYRQMLPVMHSLRNPHLIERHWAKIEAELHKEIVRDNKLTLGVLLQMQVLDHADFIVKVATEATQEAELQHKMSKLTHKWAAIEFVVKPYKDTKDKFILAGVDEVMAALDDSMIAMSSITASRYVSGIRADVDRMEGTLKHFAKVLEQWLECQKSWLYLESIFCAPDIQRQLPKESKAFYSVDHQYSEMMRRTKDRSNALQAGTTPGWLEIFTKANATLDRVQKSLEDYLEVKRMAFPRFYFLSNDELLEILAQTRNVQAVQPHMSKCFDGIKRLEFGDDPKSIDILAMISPEGERVELGKNLKARGTVEQWLSATETSMATSLRRRAKLALQEYSDQARTHWVLQHPAQIMLTISQVFWCRSVEDCLGGHNGIANAPHAGGSPGGAPAGASPGSLLKFHQHSLDQLGNLTRLVTSPLKSLERRIVTTLITIDVHARDVLDTLINDKVCRVGEFGWQMQLRYYWEDDGDECAVRQTNTRFLYAWEYLGAQPRLVITPLTDRCYMTLTGALHLKLGGAPAGPAGTGKTETTKDLGKALGIQCVVFNCGENLDYKFMGKFFSGLAQCGAWACFDEFNRIDIEVLSVVAQQMLTIQNALKAQVTKFNFEGREIKLLPTCGVFITMNPGYAGRTELPDNLKVLFRPVSMMIPDYALVAEVMLFSEGFREAKVLSRKMVKLYKLSSEQLSQQDHYDFGMRAVKSVLVMAGGLKRSSPHLSEELVLIRAFKDSNLPKFLAEDASLFLAILGDLFPGAVVPPADHGELEASVEQVTVASGLQAQPDFTTKVLQLYETLNVRFGVMLVGPTGGGKTTVYRMLQAAVTKLRDEHHGDNQYQRTHSTVLNPKAIRMAELYGEYNLATNEWRDGLASTIIRTAVADTTQDRKWVVFDGPVDAVWIENMNTVLDDNCTLCLPNGERIKLNPTLMRMLFEVQDLAVASPATVSRCGMVYVPPEMLGWRPFVQSWLQRLPALLTPPPPPAPAEDEGEGEEGEDKKEGDKKAAALKSAPSRKEGADVGLTQEGAAANGGAAAAAAVAGASNLAVAGSEPQPPGAAGQAAGAAGMVVPGAEGAPAGNIAAQAASAAEPPPRVDPANEDILFLLGQLMDLHVNAGLAHIRGQYVEAVPSVDINLVTTLTRLFTAMMLPARTGAIQLKHAATPEATQEMLHSLVSKVFVFAYTWSIGGNLAAADIDGFDGFVRDQLSEVAPMPATGTVYDYFIDPITHVWVRWDVVTPAFVYHPAMPFFQMMVPTVDSTRYAFLLQLGIDVNCPILFTGPTGVGKTAVITNLLAKAGEAEPRVLMPVLLNLSAQTSSVAVQEAVEGKMKRKRMTRLGTPAGCKAVLFIDDVNMPVKEVYGAQPPIELLRQLLDHGGWYDRQKLFWKWVEDLTTVAACAPPGGGRNEVTPRFFRHFAMFALPAPSQAAMQTIFSAILGGWLSHGFPLDFKRLLKPMVDSSVAIYHEIVVNLLPTPAKSHYTFNLRDVSKVIQGVLMATPSTCNSAKTMQKLWAHEVLRVFQDRLVDAADKRFLSELLHDQLRRAFDESKSHDEYFYGGEGNEGGAGIMFGDYLRMGLDRGDRVYEEVKDPLTLPRLLQDYSDEYNMSHTNKLSLVFFRDAVDHISRIVRILRQPRGNAVLVGVGGSGKQSLTRFASFISSLTCFQIELTRGYNTFEFREDIRKLYKRAGVEGEGLVFLFTDNQIVNEGFLEDINNILNSGEVPGLFPPDEHERILNDIRPYVASLGRPESRDVCYSTFIERVRENLHLVLCMSPVGDAFRNRCRQFPSLINCCNVDWFLPWPKEALLSVSSHLLAPVDVGGKGNERNLALAQFCVEIHEGVADMAERFYEELRRRFYLTPKSYLDLIDLYTHLLAAKRLEKTLARDRLQNGLNKLKETEEVVGTMKVELSTLQPLLKVKREKTAELLERVTVDQAAAENVKAVVSAEEAEVKKQAVATKAIRDDAQADLDEATPALEAAVEALNALNKQDIVEIKSFTKPPGLVLLTMEAVCILLNEKPDWDSAKKVLTDTGFVKRLVEFDKDNISSKTSKALGRYIDDPVFVPDVVAKQSNAAKSLCMWVRAMDVYSKVIKVVEPKRKTLAAAEEMLRDASEALHLKQKQLAEAEAAVDELKRELTAAETEQASLSAQAELTSNRLVMAAKLTTALGEEEVRWRATAASISDEIILLIGDVFLSSACVSYFGPLTGLYRDELRDTWFQRCLQLGIPVSEHYTLRATLSDPVDVREWAIWGLPADAVSVDNAIMVTRGRRWPLMIDPQTQANRWVKAMEAKTGIRVTTQRDHGFLRVLENSIIAGNPVLLEDVGETLDPALEPILLKQTFKRGDRLLIRLGDSDIDYNINFKLYITTKLPNPHYLPDVCIKVTIVNFTVTSSGLEDQLLADVVRMERADLEEQKDRLVVSISNDKKQLKELEDKILKLLKESTGNILDDEALINTLNNSKLTSGVISTRVREAEVTEREINAAREIYRPVAHRGSTIFFVIADMARVDPMYQFSLAYFSRLFSYCIAHAEHCDDVNLRLKYLIQFTTLFMCRNVCRGLFEQHKLIFKFLLTACILRTDGAIAPAEWSFLLKGAITESGGGGGDKQKNAMGEAATYELVSKWPARTIWINLLALEKLFPEVFRGLCDSVKNDSKGWQAWVASLDPFSAPLPPKFSPPQPPTGFQRLLLVKSLAESGLLRSLHSFVEAEMGADFVNNPPVSLESLFRETSPSTPVIFILSSGADPTSMLQRFGEKVGHVPGQGLHMISLGQGQGPVAEVLLAKASKNGDWLCLQNCHLAVSWMPNLQRIVEGLQANGGVDVNPEFRLWLTSMPTANFPVPVLQGGIKLTIEPPKGLRANLMRSYVSEVREEVLDAELGAGGTKRAAGESMMGVWKTLVFGVAFFHAVVQERRKFGPLGWNIKYDFNNSDLECALQTLRNFLEDALATGDSASGKGADKDATKLIPWHALTYVTGEITYGGRVTDDQDRRCLLSILKQFYSPAVLTVLKGGAYVITPRSGEYRVPPPGSHLSYVEHINALPFAESPEVFGLHDNANITFNVQESKKVLDTVLSIQSGGGGGGGSSGPSSDELVVLTAQSFLSDLPPLLRREEAHSTRFAPDGPSGLMSSLSTVLLQEMDRFNRLLSVVRSSLEELQRAIKGLVVMSAELEAMYASLSNNAVPALWTRASYASLKSLGPWVKDLGARVAALRAWLLMAGDPPSFWLSGLFYPQGFMTGVLQMHARKYQIPIDTLSFGFSVPPPPLEGLPSPMDEPHDGVFVEKLFLDGARWDPKRSKLVEAAPGEMRTPLPPLLLLPTENYVPPAGEYQCPLYKTSVRAGVLTTTGASSNYILSVSLPCTETPDYWVLQGVAMLCQDD